jgi:hypothetical protein
LLEIVAARNTSCSFSSLLYSWQQEADKNTNNGDDNQKFDEGEPRRLPGFLRLHLIPFIYKVR